MLRFQSGRSPAAAHAACLAAPSATYSLLAGTSTGRLNMLAAAWRRACDFEPPPIRRTLSGVPPDFLRTSMASASEFSTPSTEARARFSGVMLLLLRPARVPVAWGRLGLRSPSRYGRNMSPPASLSAD